MRTLPWLCAAFLTYGCAPPTAIERAGSNQEIVRDATVALHADPRFTSLKVKWVGEKLMLLGRVDNRKAEREALELAASRALNSTVISHLEIRPR